MLGTEGNLAAERERLRITLASIGDAVISTDAEGRVVFLNSVAETLTGWTQREAEGQPLLHIFQIVNEYTRTPAENPVIQALSRGVVVGLANHTVLIARDGTERPIDDSAAPMLDESGSPIGAVLVFRDITERRRLEESQARLAAIVESSHDAIVSKTLDGIIRTWNTAAERLFGYTAKEAGGQPITLIIPSDRLDEEKEILARLSRGERIEHFETVRRTKDGRSIDISLSISPIRDAEGRIIGASKIARDISDRRRAEEDRARLAAIVESSEDAIVGKTLDGIIRSWNAAAERLFGYTAEEAVGQPITLIIPRDRLDEERMILSRLSRGERVEHFETIRRAKDGRLIDLSLTISPIRDAQGRVIGASKIARDVTERKRAEEAQAELAAIVESAQDAIISQTLDGIIRTWNTGAERLFGYRADEAIGQPITLIIPPDLLEEEKMILSRLSRGEQIEHYETVRQAKNGNLIDISLTISPIRNAEGGIIGASNFARDMTEQKRILEALKESDRRKDEFLALLAHELRNPLAPLRNGLQVMRLANGGGYAVAKAREMMDRQLSHMVRLIDDLLDVSRISLNKMELRRSRVLLADVVSSAVETARPAIEAAGHKLTVLLPPEPILLDADLTRLAQVFGNLLNNSAKYTERGGHIWLTATREGDRVSVAVRDTGVGIPAGALPTVFEMFSQVSRPIERSGGGLGIGLALVKGLVEMHGGSVEAASPGLGKGSTFTVRLPVLKDGAEPSVETQALGRPDSGGSKLRILVVDDNRDAAESMALMLQLLDHEVRTAHDGLEAVALAEEIRPQVIFMDVGMPQLDGYEATRRIREHPWGRDMAIIALTGWGQEADRTRSKEAGCDGHLVKPVELTELGTLLEDLQKKRGRAGGA